MYREHFELIYVPQLCLIILNKNCSFSVKKISHNHQVHIFFVLLKL